jgi:hypothetical protein
MTHRRHVRIKKKAIPLIGFDAKPIHVETAMIITIPMTIVAFALRTCPPHLHISAELTLNPPP